VVYCQSGVRAAETAAVLETLGFGKVKVYDSSWLGYAARLDAPAERETFFNVGAMNGRLASMQRKIDELERMIGELHSSHNGEGRLPGRESLLTPVRGDRCGRHHRRSRPSCGSAGFLGPARAARCCSPTTSKVGAGTFHTATFLRALGPRAVEGRLCAALAPPQGRPLRREPEPPAALLPVPGGAEAVAGQHPGTLPRLAARHRHRPSEHDIRFVEDDWESPDAGRLGPGLGSLARRHGSHPVHLFPAGRRLDLQAGHSGEITYGLERLAMYLQGVENVFDLVWAPGGHLRRRLSPERGRAVDLQLRALERRLAVRAVRRSTNRKPSA
jgi:hypothetical protein